MDARQRLLKLLALASSPNAHEAAVARQAAEAHMRRYGLAERDVEVEEELDYVERHLGGRRGWPEWRLSIATEAARYCGADVMFWDCFPELVVKVVGRGVDVCRGVALYERMVSLVDRMEAEAAGMFSDGNGLLGEDSRLALLDDAARYGERGCVDSFRRGLVLGVVVQYSRARAREAVGASTGDSSVALVRATSSGGQQKRKGDVRPRVLDDVPSQLWYELGAAVAMRRVVVERGEVGLREESEASDEERKTA